MRLEISDWHTDAYPTKEEVTLLCKPGTENACIWLVAGKEGFRCIYNNKSPFMTLVQRFEKGQTNAKRDGCNVMKNIEPSMLGIGTFEKTIIEIENEFT